MTDHDLLREISAKLSVLISLSLNKEGGAGVQDHVVQLSRFGLSTAEIADILNTTPGTVAVAKSRLKRKSKG